MNEPMKIRIPELCMVVLMGPSGAGKSTFAARHFLDTEVLSSDRFRAWVSDDETNQEASQAAFDILHLLAEKRLRAGRLVVFDATNVQETARERILAVAKRCHVHAVVIALNIDPRTCHQRNQQRPNRDFGPHVVRRQFLSLKRSLKKLRREGFRRINVLDSPEAIEQVQIERVPLHSNLKHEQGPFDLIGDVHGCYDELLLLLEKLGYRVEMNGSNPVVTPPEGRKAVFVGDLVDRGPKVVEVLRLVMNMVQDGVALCVSGNHENRLFRKLSGKNVALTHGLQETMEQLEAAGESFMTEVRQFVDKLVSHYELDHGRLVVAHAGLKEEYIGRVSGKVRSFAMYGDVTGEKDEYGLPVRNDWAREYRGRAFVVYGHTPREDAIWKNRTINIDTGCVFGGKLTGLRYPERTLESVEALELYCEPSRPFKGEAVVARREYDDLLDLSDVQGRHVVETRYRDGVTIREGQAAAALEVMSRFAIDPRWLLTLPPTMSPSETSRKEGFLEYPTEAFRYFQKQEVKKVVCQEKHMGSRFVVVVCKSPEVVRQRFGIETDMQGVCYSRTGRSFFSVKGIERGMLRRLHLAMERSGLWEELETDWICLDCELMPWSSKGRSLLEEQYAPVGRAAERSLSSALGVLKQAEVRGMDVEALLKRQQQRADDIEEYVAAYRGYCWSVNSLMDLKLAPFHILATEGRTWFDKDHLWHMETLGRLCDRDSQILLKTRYRVVEVEDEEQVAAATQWWEDMTEAGGEGMVVKPLDFVAHGPNGLVQPALKCRGRRYLRIIYGPEYTDEKQLKRLRKRGLKHKRSLALREFALGAEALERFVRDEPLYRVHECVFGVLALESEAVDPRL
jgi:protein phosphatase